MVKALIFYYKGLDGEDYVNLPLRECRLGRHGDGGVADAGSQLREGVAGAGGDYQDVQQLLRADGFGLGYR